MASQQQLDEAIVAYRENPTEETRRRLLALQQSHTTSFFKSQTVDYIKRTR